MTASSTHSAALAFSAAFPFKLQGFEKLPAASHGEAYPPFCT